MGGFTHEADHPFPTSLHSIGRGRRILDLYYVAHVDEWEPYTLHDFGHVSLCWVATVHALHISRQV